MGTNIRELIKKEEIKLEDLSNKILVVDAFNMIYQFLTTIRQRDGSPLLDSKGNITSHLVGLFNRCSNLIQKNIKLAFVFDGKPPEFKIKERERRSEAKKQAQIKYEKARQKEDVDLMKKYASRTVRLTPELIEEAKLLLSALGIPIIQAPSEGEAQAAYIVNKGDAYAVVSQDYDSFLFGAKKIIRNLTIAGRKKKTRTAVYESIKPEIVNISENLNHLGIDQDQLIILAILVGTDFNIGGIKGIGQKIALKLVKEQGKDFKKIFQEVKWDEHFDIPWEKIYETFKNMPTTDDYELKWKKVDEEKIKDLLIDKHDFSEERVNNTLEKLSCKKNNQKGLFEFI